MTADGLMYAYGPMKRLPDRLGKLRRRTLRRPQDVIVHAATAHAAVGTVSVCDKPQPFGWHCCRGAHLLNTPCAVLPRRWNVVAKARWASQTVTLW